MQSGPITFKHTTTHLKDRHEAFLRNAGRLLLYYVTHAKPRRGEMSVGIHFTKGF
jgi:hypothetical protein